MKARMLALKVSLALIVLGGAASVLVTHLSLASAHKAVPFGPLPSATGAAKIGAARAAQVSCDCSTVPCSFPDGTSTGVPNGTVLRSVPGQVSSGPGWHFDPRGGYVVVTARATVLSGLSIPYNLEIDASDVTVQNVKVVTGGYFGISLRHTTGVTIEDSTIRGQNLTSGRVGSAIDDVYGDSTGIVIKNNDISEFRTGVQVSTGLIAGNYIHDPGYIHGDHTNGIFVGGGTKPLTIENNTIFDGLNQTDAISLDAARSGVPVANKTVENNLLAGGSYTIYGGAARGNPTSNIVIEGNRFAQLYYPRGGQYGPAAYVNLRQPGNVWSGNVWSGISLPGSVHCRALLPVTLPGATG